MPERLDDGVVVMVPEWQGKTSFQSAVLHSSLKKTERAATNQLNATIGLHILYASWNGPSCCSIPYGQLRHSLIPSTLHVPSYLLSELQGVECSNSSCNVVSSAIQVDESNEALDLCIGDCTHSCIMSRIGVADDDPMQHYQRQQIIPRPPETLPAILLVVKQGQASPVAASKNTKLVQTRYLSSVEPSTILHQLSCRNQDSSFLNQIQQEVQEKLEDIAASTMIGQECKDLESNNAQRHHRQQQAQDRWAARK